MMTYFKLLFPFIFYYFQKIIFIFFNFIKASSCGFIFFMFCNSLSDLWVKLSDSHLKLYLTMKFKPHPFLFQFFMQLSIFFNLLLVIFLQEWYLNNTLCSLKIINLKRAIINSIHVSILVTFFSWPFNLVSLSLRSFSICCSCFTMISLGSRSFRS